MFCPICGTENDNKAKFCKQCGAALQPAASGAQPQPSSPKVNPSQERNHIAEPNRMHAEAHQTQNSVAKNQLNEAAAKVKALPKNVLFGGIAAIVVIILLFMFASSNAKTINLDQYLTIKGSGYNGYGSADATIDWDAIKERYGKKISIKKKKSGSGLSLDDLYGYTDPIDVLSNCVSVSFKPSKGLSNGDEVSYTWDIEEDVLNKFVDCKLKYKDGTQKIDGLEEVGQFDPFHDITVEYDGIAPNGEAYFNYNGSELSSYDFSADKTRGLRNGDVITLTLNLNESRIRDLAESYGRVPSTTEKQYTVEGLGSYLESLSQVDDASLQAMQQQAADRFGTGGIFTDEHSKDVDGKAVRVMLENGKNTSYWSALKQDMMAKSGIGEEPVLVFESQEEFERYREDSAMVERMEMLASAKDITPEIPDTPKLDAPKIELPKPRGRR